MKMKVRTDNLRAAIKKYVAQDAKRFERETAAYNKKLLAARTRYVENVDLYLTALQSGEEPYRDYNVRDRLERGCNFPREPKEAETHTDLLVKLDLAEDQVLVVDDHSDYMKFLSGRCVCK